MGEWPEYPLGSFVNPSRAICYGIVQPGKPYDGGVPIVRVNNLKDGRVDSSDALRVDPEIEEKYERSRLEGGELLLTLVGSMGLSAIVPSELRGWNVARAVGVIPLKETVDRRWLHFVLRSQPSQDFIQTHANTTVQATFNLRDLARLPIPMPPDDLRLPASELLSVLDDKIELNRRMNDTLEAMARAIFKDWFVDFGPTRAKADGRSPYLAPELWVLFPDTLDNEDKPVGWQTSLLGDRIEILDSRRVPLSSREREGRQGPYPYHGATGVMDYVDDFLFEEVHVLVGEDGSVVKPDGKPFTQYVWGQFWANNHAHVLRGKDISNEMLLCFLQETDITPYVTGAVQAKLNQKNLKAIPFPPSSSDVAMAFEKLVGPLFEQVRLNSGQSRTLSSTRDLLLPRLMSGQIRLREAEKAVEAVA